MKLLLLFTVLTACGPAFTAEDPNGKELNPPPIGGDSGTMASAGAGGLSGASSDSRDNGPTGGNAVGDNAGSGGARDGTSGANTGGNTAMAGGPAVGEGGTAGQKPFAACLEGSDCARDCTSHQQDSDCMAILQCWSQQKSFDSCSQFTSLGLSIAKTAVQNCGCK